MVSAYNRSSMRQSGMRMPPLCSTSRTLGLTPWLLMGIAAIFIPMIIWNTQSQEYYRQYGMMRQYEEYYQQQKEGNNENNDNYYIYRECSFFNIACKKNQYYYATVEDRQGANEDGIVLQTYPDWFILLGGYEQTEAMQKWKANNGSGARYLTNGRSSGMKFAYTINLLLFIMLMAYGAISIHNRQNLSQLVQYLLLAFVLTFANLIMAIQSLVSLNEGMFEESFYGWYGQIGVLIVYTNFGIILFSVTYVLLITYAKHTNERASQNNADWEEMNEERYWSQFEFGSMD